MILEKNNNKTQKPVKTETQKTVHHKICTENSSGRGRASTQEYSLLFLWLPTVLIRLAFTPSSPCFIQLRGPKYTEAPSQLAFVWIMEILKNEFLLPCSSLNNFLLCSYLKICFNNKTCFLFEFSSVLTIAMAYISFLLQYYLLTHLNRELFNIFVMLMPETRLSTSEEIN